MRCLLPILAALLAACQPAYIKGMPNESSPYFQIPTGTQFVLRREITVPAHTDRLYFQDGTIHAWYRVNKYDAYCVLQVDATGSTPRPIEPDKFTVTKVSIGHFFQLVQAPARAVRTGFTADGGAARLIDEPRSDSGDTYEVFGSVMQLRSARQPRVRRLTCADWGLEQRATYISVSKMRRALGAYFRIDVGPS